MTDWSSLITLDVVLGLHAKTIADHGQPLIVNSQRAKDCVDGTIGNAWSAESYTSTDDGALPGLCFAAHLLYYIVRDHCFQDGNKRIGWIAAMEVLASLGLTIKATDDEAEELVLRISDGSREDAIKSGLQVLRWIAGRIEAPHD